MARKPSHFGSKRNSPSLGMVSASVASIGSIGGAIGKELASAVICASILPNDRSRAAAGTSVHVDSRCAMRSDALALRQRRRHVRGAPLDRSWLLARAVGAPLAFGGYT